MKRLRRMYQDNKGDPVFWFCFMGGLVAGFLMVLMTMMAVEAAQDYLEEGYESCLPSKAHGHICGPNG